MRFTKMDTGARNSLTQMLEVGRYLPTGSGYVTLDVSELSESFMKKCPQSTAWQPE